jgi:hypothetical protein
MSGGQEVGMSISLDDFKPLDFKDRVTTNFS